MKKYTLFLAMVLLAILSACGNQPISPTVDANAIAQTAAAMVWTEVAKTKEAEPTATPTMSPDILTQTAKNSYKSIDYQELIASNNHVSEKIILRGKIILIYEGAGFILKTAPENYDAFVDISNPVPNIFVGDMVTVYGVYEAFQCVPIGDGVTIVGVYENNKFLTQEGGGTEYCQSIITNAFFEK